MDFDKISSHVLEKIRRSLSHPLNEKCAYKYYSDFFYGLRALYEKSVINTLKSFNSFCNKMQLDGKFDLMTYYQGISEISFWIYSAKNNYSFLLEKKISDENNCDVDMQIFKDDITFNIEVKCPTFEIAVKPDLLKIDTSFRSVTKDVFANHKKEIESDIVKPIMQNSDCKYADYEFEKNCDNRLVDYLKSGQQKFIYSNNNSINVLVISVPSENIESYWGYLYNCFSGLFTEKSFNPHCDYDKVDVILLTNMIAGHQKPNDAFNSWDISSYCNLLCKNPYSRKHISKLHNGYIKLQDLFPNDTERFESFYNSFIEKCEKEKLPLQGIMFPTYLHTNYPLLWKT